MKTTILILLLASASLPNIQGFCPIMTPVELAAPAIYTFTGSILMRYVLLDRHKRLWGVLIPAAVSTFTYMYRGDYPGAALGLLGSSGASLVIYRF